MAQRERPAKEAAITLTHPNAAGIDIGSAAHFVAVPPDRDDEPVREFASFTADLHRLADWLDACSVDTVAMGSTGVYWIPLYELLESRGFTVLLVNARHVNNVSGRKSDVLDCQWQQQLMSFGLLRGAFRPSELARRFCAPSSQASAMGWLALAKLKNSRIRASEDEIAKSLQGTWGISLVTEQRSLSYRTTPVSHPSYSPLCGAITRRNSVEH